MGGRGKDRLERLAGAFLASPSGGREEVAAFAGALGSLGRTAVIGGMLRDLHLSGPRGFRSDVDFVVHPPSLGEYDRFVAAAGGVPNRFGCHAVRLSRWKVEVWPLQRTWAWVAGHARLGALDDILGTTFFDWDAVLYDVGERRVIAAPGYFERVAARVLDVNLAPNPNPLGNAVRALRYAHRWGAALGEGLAAHVAGQVEEAGWDALVAYEARSFTDMRLGAMDGRTVRGALAGRGAGPVGLPPAPR